MGRYSDLLNGVYEKTDAYKKALVDSGYEPNENTGFVDTVQSAAWGSLGGTLGFVSALGQKAGMDSVRDWALNEAQYAGKKAAVNADLTNYQDNGFTDYRYWTNGHILSDTANLVGSNLVDVGLIGGSIIGGVLAAPETGGTSLAGTAAMVGSVVAKRAAQSAGKTVVKKLLGDAAENLATRAVTKYGFEEGAKLFSKDMLMDGLKQGGMKAAKNIAEYTTSSIAENTSNAGQVYMDSLARGVDFDTATDRSMQAFGDGVVPSLAEYGIEKMGVTGSLAALATKGGKVFTKALRGAAVNAAITGQLEGGVEAWQSLVQDRAMGEDNGAELLKPSTWTDNMKDSYNSAVGPSMLLGAFGGARNGIANRGNNNVATTIDIDPQLEQPADTQTTTTSTPSTLGEVAETMNNGDMSVNAPDISQPVTSSNPIANVLIDDDVTGNSAIDSNAIGSDYIDMSNMSIPSNMGEQAIANSNVTNDVADLSNTNTVDPHQDIKNEMHERFAKENKVDEVIGAKDKTFADMAAKYSEFYKDQPLDVIHQLKPKDFKEDFINEGFNKTEANHASRLIADNLKKENPLPKINGQEVIDSANQSGVELTPKEIEALQQENPPHAVINNINKRIEKQQEKAYKEGQKQEKAQLKEDIKQNKADEERKLQQKDKRQEKKYTDNEYPTSSNKAFFDTVFKDDAPSVAYKFKKAMKKRNQDISKGKQHVNNVKQYLANEGIISEKYGKDKINALSEYTKAMDNERIQAKSIADPKQRKDFLTKSGINHSNLINFNKHIDNIIQNNQGLPNEEVLDKIDKSMVKYHNEFGNVTQSKHYQKLVNQAKGNQTLAKERLHRINQAIGLDTPYQSTKEIKKALVGEKEPKQRKPREVKKKAIKGHSEVTNLLENKSSLEDTHKALEALSKSDELNDGQKIHIKQIQNAIKKNTDDEGVFKSKELDNTGKKALNKLNELQADINAKHGAMTTSQFNKALKGIRNQAYGLFNKYPNKETLAKLETIDHTYKTPSSKTVAQMIRENTASIPSKINKSIIDSSAGFNDKAVEWVNKEFNKKSDKVETAIRNEIIATTLKKAYNTLLQKFGTVDKAIESDSLAVRQFVRNVIAAFPKGKFGELDKDLKTKGDKARENLFGSSESQALTQRVSDGFAPLIDFVKQYNEKIKADKKAEKQAKQENTIKAVKTRASDEGIRVAKYKATINVDNGSNELAPIRVTFTFDDKKDATEDNARNIAEELGNKYYFSPDEMELVEQKDNSVAFDTIAGLSYSDLSNAQTLHASVVAMRAKVIKATLDNNEKEEMMFEIPHNASFDGLKDAINDAYGKGTYDFIRETVRGTTVYDNDSTDTIYVVKKGTELTEDKKDELTGAYYQQGKDEPVKRTENKHVDTDTLRGVSHIFDNADKGYKLSIGEQRKLLDSIVYYVGEQANDVFAYLEKATYLSINKLDSNTVENGKINRGLGKVFLKQKQLTNTSSTFLHEMAHDAVFNVLESKNKSKRKILDGLYHTVVTLAKESAYNGEYQGQYGGRFIPNGNSKGSIKSNEPSTGLGRTKGQSVESSSDYEEMLRYNGNTQTRPLYRSTTRNSVNDGSSRVHSKRTGLQNERLERQTLASSLQFKPVDKSGRTLVGREGNVDRRMCSITSGQVRAWNRSANVIDTFKKSDFQIQDGQEHSNAYRTFKSVILDALHDDKVTMSEKMKILGIWFSALEHLEKKYKPNSLSRGENVYQSLMGDSRIYHEMIAYGSHTVLPNSKVAKLFTIGRTAMKVAPRKEMATKETNKMIITHHLGSGGIRHFINQMEHGKGLDNLSTAVTTVDDAFSPALNKFGKTFIVIDKKAVDDIHNNRAVGDAYTITHRKENILKGKGRDIDLLRKENDGRCKVAGGKDAVFNLALASFLDYGNNLDVFKHRLESRSDKYADDDYGIAEKDDIIRNIIDIAKTYGNSKLAKTLENKTYEEQKEYLGKSTSLAKTFLSGVYASLQHYSKTGDRNYEKSFKRGSGYKEMPLGLDKEIDNLISSLSSYIPRYGEIKFTEPITKEYVRAIYDVDGSISKENIAKLQDMGFNVVSVSSKDKKLGESLIKTLEEDEKELTLFQNGKEDTTMKSDPSGAIVNSKEYKELRGDKKNEDRITVHKRSTMAGNIPLFRILKYALSPSYLIKRFVPEFSHLFNLAEKTQAKAKKKIKEYKTELDSILAPLTEKLEAEFYRLLDDVTKNGMEFVQVIPTKTEKGEQVSLLLDSSKDKFEEFSTNAEAESVAKELRKYGYNTYIDYQNQVFRVIASKDPIKAYRDNERAAEYAMKRSREIALQKGYSPVVWDAYVKYRKLLNKMQFECANVHAKLGDTEPIKYLWGYTPYEHSRFGVYVEQKVLDDDGKEKMLHSVIASFRREKDAKKYIEENLLNNPEYKDNTFAIVEQNRNYNNPRVSMDSHYQTIDNDYFHENMVLEYKSEEEREKDFQRMSSVFPEIKKFIDSDLIRQPMSAEDFVALVNDGKKLKQAGIDKVKLAKELNKGHINDFFKGRKKVKKGELKDFFVTHIGNQAKNRYNYKRKLGATGSNPNRRRTLYDYSAYMAKHICNAEFYHLTTKQWEHSFGSNYEEDVKNRKPLTDKQKIIKRLLEDVMGIPNHFDEALNETISEIPHFGEFMSNTFGYGWFTRLLKNSMEVTAVCKLGLFRLTAILAQYGTLINTYSVLGNKQFLNALKEVPTWHTPEKYKKLFEKLAISDGFVGIESDVMDNPDSIMNSTKVGKVLQWTMKPFEKADLHTRRIAAVGAYNQAINKLREQNKTRKEKWTEQQIEEMAIDKAREFVRDTNFNYSRIDAPGLFTEGGSLLALLLQFKKYPMKELEFLYKLTRLPKNPTKQDIKDRRARLIRFFGSFAVITGMFGLPAANAADELAEWIFGISPKQTTKDLLYEWAGNDPVKKQLVIFNLYGLPGNAGVDFSRNIGLGDAVPTEGKELLGPTISSISDMYNGFKYNQSANNILLNELRNLSPVFANTYQAFTGKQRDWKKGLDTTDYTPTERFAKLLGFRPIRESMDKDMAYSLSNKTKKLSDDKKAAIYRYIDDPSNKNEEMLKKYNIKKEEVKKIKEQLTKSKLSTSASHVNSKNKSKEYEKLREQRDNYVDFSGEGE